MNYILVAIALWAAGSFGCQKASQDAAVAARVNGRDILKTDVEKYFRFRTQDLPQKPAGDMANLLKLEILRDLIVGEIMVQKAEQLKLRPADSEVDAQIRELKGRSTDAEFKKNLEQRGFSETDLRREISRSLSQQKVVQSQVDSKIEVSDAEIGRFYEENKESFHIKEQQYRLGQILVTADPGAPVANLKNDKALNDDQASRKIQMLVSRLRAGEDFEQLAREYSEDPQTARLGGDLGYQPVSSLERFGAPFKENLLKMKVGEVTPVFRAADGYGILKLLGKQEPGQRNLQDPEIQQTIRQELQSRKHQLLSSAFSEQIHSEARVENFLAREILAGFPKDK